MVASHGRTLSWISTLVFLPYFYLAYVAKKGQKMSVQGLGNVEIFQICVIVDDVEKYTKQYSEIFGLPMPKEYHVTAGHEVTKASYHGSPTEAKAKIVSWQLGPVQFELLEPLGGPSEWQDFLDRNGVGVHHIAF